jgi:TetR/AcrR family transcriptional repressor of nem operon
MSRVSQAEAQANRRRVVQAASRLFREKGIPNVSVAEVMEAAGLTHGGFYKQFESKSALVDEAAAQGFTDMLDKLALLSRESDGHQAAWSELLGSYLSGEHRDHPGDGCPAAGFAGDFAHGREHAETYSAGVRRMAEWIAPDKDGLAALACLVGGILLARATADTPLSGQILESVHESLALRHDSGRPRARQSPVGPSHREERPPDAG